MLVMGFCLVIKVVGDFLDQRVPRQSLGFGSIQIVRSHLCEERETPAQ